MLYQHKMSIYLRILTRELSCHKLYTTEQLVDRSNNLRINFNFIKYIFIFVLILITLMRH